MGLLFPAIQGGMERARSAKCISHLRQLGIACLSYAGDNEGFLPYSVYGQNAANDWSGHDGVWCGYVAPYLVKEWEGAAIYRQQGGNQIFFCPCSKDEGRAFSDYGPAERMGNGPGTPGVLARYCWGTLCNRISLSAVRNPARVLLLADVMRATVLEGDWSCQPSVFINNKPVPEGVPNSFGPRHGYDGNALHGRFNLVYCDGHADSLSYGDSRMADKTFRTQLLTPF
jgi:prepilin-type processing-associated H-X9-DG protein